MWLNFKEICRLCLKSRNDLHSIFDTTDKFQEKIQSISPTINVVLKEEPFLCGDNSDSVTFSTQVSSLENSKYKQENTQWRETIQMWDMYESLQ